MEQKTFLSHLDWRFATKKFDPEKKVSRETLAEILRAIRFAPTSYGLQPFRVYIVENPILREKMKAVSYMQSQVTDASHILVFAARTDAQRRIEEYIDLLSGGSPEGKEKMKPLRDMLESFAQNRSEEFLKEWSARQAYIALGFALSACAEMEVDSCPMEGFSPADMDAALGLPANEKSVVMLAIGYRAAGPEHPKVRFSESDLFVRE